MVAPAVGYAAYAVYLGIGTVLAALTEACASSEYICNDPNDLPIKNQPGLDEFVSVNGQRKIVANQAYSKTAVDTYFKEVVRREGQVDAFFGFQSPLRGKISLFLVDENSPNNECRHSNARACATWGAIIFAHPLAQLKDLNGAAESNLVPGPLVHEMSHALRHSLVELPKGLEEGLAVYTEIQLLSRQWPSGGKPDHVAKKIFSGPMKPGDKIQLPKGTWGDTLTFMGTSKLDTAKVVFTYNTNTGFLPYSVLTGKPQQILPDLIVQITPNGSQFSVALYQRPILLKNTYLDVVDDYQCSSQGSRHIEKIVTEDFEMTTLGELTPYDKAAPYSNNGKYFPSNFCFWDSLRDRAGHNAIQSIIRSMVSFSQDHEGEDAELPFFQIVQDATGMNSNEVSVHFERFSVPTDNASYPTYNGICWK